MSRGETVTLAGTIPACAGEPAGEAGRPGGRRDYPRVCGGTRSNRSRRRVSKGLSPRVRGNHGKWLREAGANRTIPACAGEPVNFGVRLCGVRDYPRVCGGTGPETLGIFSAKGLSPRVRGNHEHLGTVTSDLGTIPACAGEPARRWACARRARDYPRVCGGTFTVFPFIIQSQGLSPRVRGNRRLCSPLLSPLGTIPACAGEPGRAQLRDQIRRDYPRVCGGTIIAKNQYSHFGGLSPRVRGNRQL